VAVITLTTDFGLYDSFVGAMKGVILSRCPGTQIVDLCHEVPPQQIRIGALRLAAAARYFPAATVHVAVVDPGVGSERRALAIEVGGQFFVGPDNGVLTLAAEPGTAGFRAVSIENTALLLTPISQTFHGRDVFAPAAAFLARGGPLQDLGPQVRSIVELRLPTVYRESTRLMGTVIDVDRFGNLITNVRQADVAAQAVEAVGIAGERIAPLSHWYDPGRKLVALFNSDGWLEVAAPAGSAAQVVGVGLDASVEVELRSDRSIA
jgi:S-adenosylmethionine hydrolase